MAYATEKRTQLRGLYGYQRLPMDIACAQTGVPNSTARNWKRSAKSNGDDWDRARAAVSLGDETFKQLSQRILEDYLLQHQAVMDQLRQHPATGDSEMSPMQRAQMLAMLSDSFNKTMGSFKRLTPEINRHAIALDALQRLSTFAQARYPQHLEALIEMLEPFGEELAKAYG
jgi:hypothetical protein